MLGVYTGAYDIDIVREFFELFKTPWEFAAPGRRYSVVLCTTEPTEDIDAGLILLYMSSRCCIDQESGVALQRLGSPPALSWHGIHIPIYGQVATFGTSKQCQLTCEGSAVEYEHSLPSGGTVRRVGYDLFSEVDYLLSQGQPRDNAVIPTLELHIEILRCILREKSISFLEIPPRPAEYDFTCCLTHDVDFFAIVDHWLDRTLAGFVGRASVGALINFLLGRSSLKHLAKNWGALCSLPFVFLRLMRDFWNPFENYAEFESDLPSTFFLVPFRNRPGMTGNSSPDRRRAVRYELSDHASDVRCAATRGHEIALHGIDAWCDVESGVQERARIGDVANAEVQGVRMHWLYFSVNSPRHLDLAGFGYDSTWGYNDAVGFRAGTSQVFRFPGTNQLLELPLTIMDSALFYSKRMGLSQAQGHRLCLTLAKATHTFGGVLVVNWHGRSLAPERLWHSCYAQLLGDLAHRYRVWHTTASRAVAWFRWRRQIRFVREGGNTIKLRSMPRPAGLPHAVVQSWMGASVSEEPFTGEEPLVLQL